MKKAEKKVTKRVRNRPNKNTQTTVYKTTTDKVGDILINQAGVKFEIIGQRFHAPTGYDDGELKIRVLKIKPEEKTGIKPYEMSDSQLKYWREKKVLVRQPREKKAVKKRGSQEK